MKFYQFFAFRVLFGVMLFFQHSIAQQTSSSPQGPLAWKGVLPPSPNAASLGSYGNIPVGTYTGTPNVTIPIYTITHRDLTLPISLNYQGSGIQVEQEASWVGLGWTLNAGGVITRTIRGGDDFNDGNGDGGDNPTHIMGYPELQSMPDVSSFNPSNPDAPSYLSQDLESDLYYFNVGGLSGKFVLNISQTGKSTYEVTLLSPSQTKVIYNKQARQWQITDENGVKYFFKTREYTYTRSGVSSNLLGAMNNVTGDISFSYLSNLNNPEKVRFNGDEYISAWYLDRIESPIGAVIELQYDPTNYATKSTVNITQKLGFVGSIVTNPPNSGLDKSFFETITGTAPYGTQVVALERTVNDRLLSKIIYGSTEIRFRTENREDMVAATIPGITISTPKRLKTVEVYTNPGMLIHSFDLEYGYFNAERLKLTKTIENQQKVYTFQYDESKGLPSKMSFDKDHWGLWNGKNNTTLIPTLAYMNYATDKVEVYFGANRETDGTYAASGMLNKINYPTGGYTSFEYEPNTYFVDLTTPRGQAENHVIAEKLINQSILLEANSPDNMDFPFTLTQAGRVSFTRSLEANDLLRNILYGVYMDEVNINQPYLQVLRKSDLQIVEGYKIIDDLRSYFQGKCPNNDGISTSDQPTCWLENSIKIQPTFINDLPAGEYIFRISKQALRNAVFPLTIKAELIMIRDQYPAGMKYATATGGGIRLKRQLDFDGIKTTTRQYLYHNRTIEQNTYSSGQIMNSERRYGYELTSNTPRVTITNVRGNNTIVGIQVNGYVFRSTPTLPLSNSAQGYYVGYDQVEVKIGAAGEFGKTIYQFENTPDNLQSLPFITDFPSDYLNLNNGFIKDEKHFDYKNGIYRLVSQTISSSSKVSEKVISFIKYEQMPCYSTGDGCKTPVLSAKAYQTHVIWHRLQNQNQTTYFPN
ncbi:hypothetical protein [Siphonobacter sp. SORGH_AS_1065]|uniref:hypothetical protein n=1 Tax=Siphonobacter sp. SORGH_AS_1065 TaxID=3041795 RepID=UPI00278845A1|nr:hypothetical protein [Siphonobacter sp. SORGH_AS_1065]MDQ1087568.1 hypothetical protein [Siphonobacter sp. SORGH_AS_1065]